MNSSLLGKVAVVTGASRGIGRAIAESYAKYGAKVVVSDIDNSEGQTTVESINNAGGNAVYFHADVSCAKAHQELVDFAMKTYGRLDIACNNAGIAPPSFKVADVPIDLWHKVIKINLDGVFYGARAQIPAMLKNGGGTIVNISSILGKVAFPELGAYSPSKHGVIGLTKQIALDYAPQNIRSIAIGPAFIQTELLDGLSPDFDSLLKLHPIGRLGKPNEIGEAVASLCSDSFSFLNGAYVPIDGGFLTQ
ncbi:short-chain dehydrogenase/reductase SDR [Nadsonia fulvescens var. elongata DSM 6958]|uniref:3-oxoacyl-[acyl-carrier-protein] reductase n=1 Tax=Nadsonia fulvescens var. elongata DSM 6958 TaxID=857566 RepID=A0A1E3PSJ8_9ASCO|nr:short-chain dehydrogenase/reductase SDR [Nadsonia fulvescens var. elongata DSM 6958]